VPFSNLFVLFAGMFGRLHTCCTIQLESWNWSQNLSKRNCQLLGSAILWRVSLIGAWSDVALGRSIRIRRNPASDIVSHCSDRNALSTRENVGGGRPLEYINFHPRSGTSMRRSSSMISLNLSNYASGLEEPVVSSLDQIRLKSPMTSQERSLRLHIDLSSS
jgi:hypothetical protein